METMMESADAKRVLDDIIKRLPTHRRALIDEEITYSDLNERVHHLQIMIKIKPGTEERMCGLSGTGFWICTAWKRRDGLRN